MATLWIVKTGTTFPELIRRRGDFEVWIARGLGVSDSVIRIVDARTTALPEPRTGDAVVVTGSHSSVGDHEEWSERTAVWLARVALDGTAVLGICYGHQLLAHGLGGTVEDNPRGPQFGTVPLRLEAAAADDPLFGALTGPVPVQCTHFQAVTALPSAAIRLGATPLDANAAYRVGERAWGVQFHPEDDGDIVRHYVRASEALLGPHDVVAEALLPGITDTPAAHSLLGRFTALAFGPEASR